jgi:hypothetical protein
MWPAPKIFTVPDLAGRIVVNGFPDCLEGHMAARHRRVRELLFGRTAKALGFGKRS